MPEVTVLMPVYNGMPYLPEAVDSILAQTLQDLTFLIINDGSTDETEDYLDGVADQRVQVVHQSNRGQGAAKNAGLALCESEFVAMMDADDVSFPTRLEAQLRFLHSNEEVGIVGTKVVCFGASRRIGFSPPLPCDHETIYADLLRGRNAIAQASLMCRTSIIKKIGGFRVDRSGEDLDMWLRMGEASRLANLDEVLLGVRVHLGSVNVRHLAEIRVRYAHAIHCAKKRAEGLPEINFDEFLGEQRVRPLWQRATAAMDLYALAQYHRGLAAILSSDFVRGYTRVAWSALCSPSRTAQLISRAIRGWRNS